ncbi:MAG: hypothetical protein WA580_03500 [Acidimicrobiales bacterium]
MDVSISTPRRRWGRVFRPGPTRFVAAALCALALAGCGTSAAVYPSFLPKKTLDPHVDSVLTGTMAKPALQVEGLPVLVKTKAFHLLITVSGPVVPGEGLPDQPPATTCTWTVTMKDASATAPVSIADFHSVDHLGSVFLMGLVPGESAPPHYIHPGERITFKLRAYELVGEGMMQWAPDHRHVVADWDYTVEND